MRRVDGGLRIGGSPLTILSAPSAPSFVVRGRPRPILIPEKDAGRELAPAFAMLANRLLWRHRARPSATLDKMRTKL
jgi:hypothetical protein